MGPAGGAPGAGAMAGRWFTHQFQRDSTDPALPALCRVTRVDQRAGLVYYQADVRDGRKGDPLMTSLLLFREVSFGAWVDDVPPEEPA